MTSTGARTATERASVAEQDRSRCRFPGCDREPVARRGEGGRLPVYCDDPDHNTRSAYRRRQHEQSGMNSAGPVAEAIRGDTERKRAEILHLAAVEFAANGYHATTTRDLSDAVGLTQPMLYYYVGNKETFLLSICEELLDTHLSAVRHLEHARSTAAERLAEFVERELTVAENHRPEVTVYLRERQTLPTTAKQRLRTRQDALERVLRAILADGADSGELELCTVDTAAAAIWAVLNAGLSGHARDIPAATMADHLSAMLLRGLLPR